MDCRRLERCGLQSHVRSGSRCSGDVCGPAVGCGSRAVVQPAGFVRKSSTSRRPHARPAIDEIRAAAACPSVAIPGLQPRPRPADDVVGRWVGRVLVCGREIWCGGVAGKHGRGGRRRAPVVSRSATRGPDSAARCVGRPLCRFGVWLESANVLDSNLLRVRAIPHRAERGVGSGAESEWC